MYIYKLTNKLNNKVYIGQTLKDLNKRLLAHKNSPNFKHTKDYPIARAIKKYGWDNFDKELIDIASSVEELNQKELGYIQKYNSLIEGGWGYNVKGGGDSIGSHSEETKRKIGESQKGVLNHAYGKTGKLSPTSKPIICLTNNQIYESAMECSKILDLNFSHISAVCRGTRGSTGGLVFRWLDENNNIIEPEKPSKRKVKKIINLNTGEDFDSMKLAEISVSKNGKSNGSLCRCMKGKTECCYRGVYFKVIE